MAKDPAALMYIDKWLTSTRGMRADERGWYLNLILYQFRNGDLPNEIEELATLCDVRFSEFEQFSTKWEQVLQHKFQQNSNGRLENEVAKEIIQSRENFKDKRSKAGKMSVIVKMARKLKASKKVIDQLKFDLYEADDETLDQHMNQHMLKQVLEHLNQLYTNKDVNVNKDKTIDADENVYSVCVKKYFDFFAQKNGGAKPKFGKVEGQKMKSIIRYFESQGSPPVESLEYIFKHWNRLSSWLQDNALDLKVFESKINTIITELKKNHGFDPQATHEAISKIVRANRESASSN